jgi:hypothetical protein
MSFCNPHSVVDNILAFQPLYLKTSRCVQMHRAACRNSRDLLKASSEERISRPWETCEANSVVFNRATIQESEITVPDPFLFFEQCYIFALEHVHHFSIVYRLGCDWCYCTITVDSITWVLVPEMVGESCESFFRSCRKLVGN